MAAEGFQSAEVEAIMKAVGENKKWNAIGGLSDTVNNDHIPFMKFFILSWARSF